MKIYIDYIFFLNFMFDFILLLSVSLILRRNIKIRRIIFGSFIGGITIFFLFLNINSFMLFLLKLIVSILMVISTFGLISFKYFLKNLVFLYISSLFLGGSLYALNIQFSYLHEGLIFYHSGLSINVIVLIILSPLIIYLYIKQLKDLKQNYSKYYKVDIKYKDNLIKLTGFLDTGNKLIDPYSLSPVIIACEKDFKNTKKYTIIPFSTINDTSVIKCIKPDKVFINGVEYKKKVRVGLVKKLKMEGVGCILNPIIIGD